MALGASGASKGSTATIDKRRGGAEAGAAGATGSNPTIRNGIRYLAGDTPPCASTTHIDPSDRRYRPGFCPASTSATSGGTP